MGGIDPVTFSRAGGSTMSSFSRKPTEDAEAIAAAASSLLSNAVILLFVVVRLNPPVVVIWSVHVVFIQENVNRILDNNNKKLKYPSKNIQKNIPRKKSDFFPFFSIQKIGKKSGCFSE